MNLEAVEHVLRRCTNLLNRSSGTTKTKQEYHYWIGWLRKEFKHYNKLRPEDRKIIDKILSKNKDLQKDIFRK